MWDCTVSCLCWIWAYCQIIYNSSTCWHTCAHHDWDKRHPDEEGEPAHKEGTHQEAQTERRSGHYHHHHHHCHRHHHHHHCHHRQYKEIGSLHQRDLEEDFNPLCSSCLHPILLSTTWNTFKKYNPIHTNIYHIKFLLLSKFHRHWHHPQNSPLQSPTSAKSPTTPTLELPTLITMWFLLIVKFSFAAVQE